MGYPLRRLIRLHLVVCGRFFFFAWRCSLPHFVFPLFCFVFFPLLCRLLTNFLCTPSSSFHALLQWNTSTFTWWRSIQHIPSICCCATALRHVRADERTASSSRNANHSVFLNYAKSPQFYSENEPNSKSTNGLLASRIGRMGRTQSFPMSMHMFGFS